MSLRVGTKGAARKRDSASARPEAVEGPDAVAGPEASAGPAAAPAPSLGRSTREAAIDFYFNSWRFVPANLLWAFALLVVLLAGLTFVPAFLLIVLVAVPVAGMHRMAALLVRGEPATFSDFVSGMRRFALPAAGVASAILALAIVLTVNFFVGLVSANPLGWFISALALYGVVGLAMYLVAFWPVLVDPRREHLPLRRRALLAGLVVVGRPGRLLALTIVIALLLAVSTVLLAAIALVTVAYVSLLATRYVLPLLDHLEARLPR